MIPLLSILCVIVGYLIGAIPFGWLVARGFRGIDIRLVGSGNIGATNVGRVLGFQFFLLVFALDLAKGLLPTWGSTRLLESLTGRPAPLDLAVLVALSTIIGHNFPAYLRFRGGKGVATSLGAMIALEPVASLVAGLAFLAFLSIIRYVSLSSLLGALVFFVVYFTRVRSAWGPEHRALSGLTIGLVVLMIVRHWKNLGRIATGTEPKVSFRGKKGSGPKETEPMERKPGGRVAVAWLIALAVIVALTAGGATLWKKLARREPLTIGNVSLLDVARTSTGHHRAERVAFADGGRLLAVTCPRYNRLVLYRVREQDKLELFRDLELDGKPVAVCTTRERLFVLERPPGDRRHVEPGWLEAFNFHGDRIGKKLGVGFYPDDLGLSPDGRLAFVLTSGRGEGGEHRPAPALEVVALEEEGRSLGRVSFDNAGDDPTRLTISAAGRCAAVALLGSNQVAAIDVSDPSAPRIIGRSPLTVVDRPYVSRGDEDDIVMPVKSGRESTRITLVGLGECIVSTLPTESGIEIYEPSGKRSFGRLSLHAGAFGISTIRPTGLAYSPERGLMAVANRSGGVHLVAIRERDPNAQIAGGEIDRTARR